MPVLSAPTSSATALVTCDISWLLTSALAGILSTSLQKEHVNTPTATRASCTRTMCSKLVHVMHVCKHVVENTGNHELLAIGQSVAECTSKAKRTRFSMGPPYLSVRWFTPACTTPTPISSKHEYPIIKDECHDDQRMWQASATYPPFGMLMI